MTIADIPACPPAKTGVHSWALSAANCCRNTGMSPTEAEAFILQHMTRKPTPANEVATAVKKAFQTDYKPSGTYRKGAVPIAKVQPRMERLSAFASRVAQPRNWRHWLWERSPKLPSAMNAYSFLAHAYLPGETVLVFDDMESKIPAATILISQPLDCRVPNYLTNGGAGAGIWFLCNPVDGEYHHNPRTGGMSCRSEESVTCFRYMVLESDTAPAAEWFAFLAQLPARIAAIYTSGGRSIHALLRIDAKSKAEFDAHTMPLKRPLKALGGDQACLSGVRLTRLPGCRRTEKNGIQKLLYLAPNPPLSRLVDLPQLRTRNGMLERWKQLCPRWNSTTEAFR